MFAGSTIFISSLLLLAAVAEFDKDSNEGVDINAIMNLENLEEMDQLFSGDAIVYEIVWKLKTEIVVMKETFEYIKKVNADLSNLTLMCMNNLTSLQSTCHDAILLSSTNFDVVKYDVSKLSKENEKLKSTISKFSKTMPSIKEQLEKCSGIAEMANLACDVHNPCFEKICLSCTSAYIDLYSNNKAVTPERVLEMYQKEKIKN